MSTEPTKGLRNAVIATVGAALAAVVGLTLTPDRDDTGRYLAVQFEGAAPPGVECLWSTALLRPEVLDALDLAPNDGPVYAYARTCAVPTEDTDTEPPLPSGIIALEHGQRVEAYDGQPEVELWLQGHPDAPWPAVCAPVGSDCEWLTWTEDGAEVWAPAPPGPTIARERARGEGCVGKPDVELAGTSSMPLECR